MKLIASIDDLISALDGPSSLGERLQITQEAVSNWKVRGEIPAGWHLRLLIELAKRGKRVDPAVFGLSTDDMDALWPSPLGRRVQTPDGRSGPGLSL